MSLKSHNSHCVNTASIIFFIRVSSSMHLCLWQRMQSRFLLCVASKHHLQRYPFLSSSTRREGRGPLNAAAKIQQQQCRLNLRVLLEKGIPGQTWHVVTATSLIYNKRVFVALPANHCAVGRAAGPYTHCQKADMTLSTFKYIWNVNSRNTSGRKVLYEYAHWQRLEDLFAETLTVNSSWKMKVYCKSFL